MPRRTPPPEAPPEVAPAPSEGVLIRAENGDVVAWDETGLILRLSDRVVADLRDRLGLTQRRDVAATLGDIDAWDLHEENGWLRFTARLDPALGPRAYRRALAGGDIVADAPGPITALLSIGGQRRAGFNPRPPAFRHHIVAPADDVGAVGLEGTARATATPHLQHLPWATRDALLAEALLTTRFVQGRALPLYLTRAETDGSATAADLASGPAFANLCTALDNLTAAARLSGTRASVTAIGLDWGAEDCGTAPLPLARDLRRLMARIEAEMARRDLTRPVFLLTAESGTARDTTHPAIEAHALLATFPGPHRLVIPAPSYMFDQTRHGRPTDTARARMAAMDAHALTEALARRPWFCPTLLLAEAQGTEIRVTARAMGDLTLSDALGAGPLAGFRLTGTDATLTAIRIAPDDPQALILTTDSPAAGATLHYAHAAPPQPGRDGLPPNRGGLRDGWEAPCAQGGAPLHRWALPAILPVRGLA